MSIPSPGCGNIACQKIYSNRDVLKQHVKESYVRCVYTVADEFFEIAEILNSNLNSNRLNGIAS